MKRLAIIAAVGLSFLAGLSLSVSTYNAVNTGLVVSLRADPGSCIGVELRPHPAFFGGLHNACDY